MDSILTTASVAPQRRADYWEEMVSQQFVPARCRPDRGQGFAARIRARTLDAVTICDVQSHGTDVLRTGRHVHESPGQFFLLSLQVDGCGRLDQQGRSAYLRPGDMALYDTAQPYALHFAAAQRQLVLRLPRAAMLQRGPGLEARVGVVLSGPSPAAKLVRDWTLQLAALDPWPSAPSRAAIAATLMDLVVDGLGALAPASPLSGLPKLAQAQALAEQRLDDLAFTVAVWAQALSISERYLRQLFAASGQSPAAYLWQRRLARAARGLRDPAQRGSSITAIALACGYSDSAHFSRAFRAAYGRAPRDYRQGPAD